jgi:hypothetical protein
MTKHDAMLNDQPELGQHTFKAAMSPRSSRYNWAIALLLASAGCAGIDDAGPQGPASNEKPRVEVAGQGQALINAAEQCDSTQWDKILKANSGATWLIERALEDFYTQGNADLRHLWFGSYVENQVMYKLLDLYSLVQSDTAIRCDPPGSASCVARPGAYAYRDDQTIAFCAEYWDFDHNQGDYRLDDVSQVGGLLHELTHLTATQDPTSDWLGYGYVNCRKAALGGNNLAVTNADNWRYYLMQVPMNAAAEKFVAQ